MPSDLDEGGAFPAGMEESLTTAHRLTLWRLAVAGGIEWAKVIVPKLTVAVRKKLARMGLVELRRERDPKSRRPSLKLELTDAGWKWIASNLRMEELEGSPGAGDVLQFLLAALDERLAEAGLSPEDIFRRTEAREKAGEQTTNRREESTAVEAIQKDGNGGVVEEEVFFMPEKSRIEPAPREKRPASRGQPHSRMPSPIVDAAILRGYLDATLGYIEVPVSIGELRSRVRLEPREFDQALARMQREGKLELDDSAGEGDAAAVIFRE